ncbi:MAG: hypothetical protein WC796_04035 [Candidatus Pacearchaeota archaeon]|jgi:hypothetical protein
MKFIPNVGAIVGNRPPSINVPCVNNGYVLPFPVRPTRRGRNGKGDPLVFLYSERDKRHLIGIIKDLNPIELSSSLGTDYELIVRGEPSDEEDGLVYLDRVVCKRDQLYLDVRAFDDVNGCFLSRFSGYQARIDTEDVDGAFEVSEGDYVFGFVYELGERHNFFKLTPFSLVDNETFRLNKDRIFR